MNELPDRRGDVGPVIGFLLGEPVRLARAYGRAALIPKRLPLRVAVGSALRTLPLIAEWGNALLGDSRSRLGSRAAWGDFARISSPKVVQRVATRYFKAGFEENPLAAARTLEKILREGHHRRWSLATATEVAKASFAAGYEPLARQVAEGTIKADSSTGEASELRRLATWFAKGSQRQPIEQLPVTSRIGILDYRQPGHESTNLGDYIQTLASLGHLLRHVNVRVEGQSELAVFARDVAKRVRSDRHIRSSESASVQLVHVQRDASNLQHLPPGTWTLVFGWYMHRHGRRYAFPLHPNILPIFVSMHISHSEMLTPEAIEYLRRWGPVGCRDWQTVATLLGVGVPAFFSGCITTTVDTLFPDPPRRGVGTAVVDSHSHDDDDRLTQIDASLLDNSFGTNLRLAVDRVGEFQEKYRAVRTSRLHAYLPARSVGCTVDFAPQNVRDVRFAGLASLDEAQFATMRDGILEKISFVYGQILSGVPVESVYQSWASACAEDVEVAKKTLVGLLPDANAAMPAPEVIWGKEPVESRLAVLVEISDLSAREYERFMIGLTSVCPREASVCVVDLRPDRVEHADVGQDKLAWPVRAFSSRSEAWAALLGARHVPTGVERIALVSQYSLATKGFGVIFDGPPEDSLRARTTLGSTHIGVGYLRWLITRSQWEWPKGVSFEYLTRLHAPVQVEPVEPSLAVIDAQSLRHEARRAFFETLISYYNLNSFDALALTMGSARREIPADWVLDPLWEPPEKINGVVSLERLRRHHMGSR